MKIFIVNSDGSFGIAYFDENDLVFNYVNCAGNSLGTAALVNNINQFYQHVVVVANWIDSSNYALQLSGGPVYQTYEVWANAPLGEQITIFGMFNDGNTGINIGAGKSKLLKFIGNKWSYTE